MANPISTVTKTQTIVLTKGEQFILPPGAVLIGATNSAAIDSSCEEVPEISYTCGTFTFPIDRDDNPHHPLDENHTIISKVIIGENEYKYQDGVKAYFATLNMLKSASSAPVGTFELLSFTRDDNSNNTVTNKRYNIKIKFKVISSLFEKTKLHIISPSFDGGLLLPAVEVECLDAT